MKTKIIIISSLLSFFSVGQTARINLEKHHLTQRDIRSSQDHNFGIPVDYKPISSYDTLEYWGEGCILAHKRFNINQADVDTLCNLEFVKNYEATTDEINQRMFGGHVMINFDTYEKERKSKSMKTKKSGIPWYYSLFLLAFLPFIQIKKHEA
ncbi:hypothetical protein [Lishizhenia tianjinensis]|uniref:hypothetical protein n=1 Tax=Lishizhenia tianjinensis TaxID=477690 RepID=UPI000B0105FD|nr:hypothetical protein [Lishizhenia tianjinensis]